MELAPAESISLRELYKSTQDQLIQVIERSLDLERKELAGQLDDVLLRQRFWEDDIDLDGGALSDLEANDALVSSIIRRYLDDICGLLHVINEAFSTSPNDTKHETDAMSLICEMNTRLCDQVEIFDAIAAIDTTNAAGNHPKPTAIGRLRRRLEEENEIFQSKDKQKAQIPRVLSLSEDLEVPTKSIQSSTSSSEGKARKTLPPRPKSSRESGSTSRETEEEEYWRLTTPLLRETEDENFDLPGLHTTRISPHIHKLDSRVSEEDGKERKLESVSKRPQKYKNGKKLMMKNAQGIFQYVGSVVSARYDEKRLIWMYTINDWEDKAIPGEIPESMLG